MTAWVLDQVLMQCSPMEMLPPDVLFRARQHPAQSASVLTMTSDCWLCIGNFQTSLGWFFRYLPILTNRQSDPVVGVLISRHPSLMAKLQSGRSLAR